MTHVSKAVSAEWNDLEATVSDLLLPAGLSKG